MARPCKFECGQMLEWDNDERLFREENGRAHSKERCQELKAKGSGGGSSEGRFQDPKNQYVNYGTELAKINTKLDEILNFLRGQGTLETT